MKLGLTVCSDGQSESSRQPIEQLRRTLMDMGYDVIFTPYIYGGGGRSGTARERADALMEFYRDAQITGIYDISGGDIANELLPYLDYDLIAKSGKIFYGYSDLTTVLNAIYTKTGNIGGLWQIKNLIWDESGGQKTRFCTDDFDRIQYHFLRGEYMEGTLVGGNIRCFLKLAGTPYFPDLTGKLLLLEALGGMPKQMITYLAQLKQLGAFNRINGILLGTFTKLEEMQMREHLEREVLEFSEGLPVAVTRDIGHRSDARCAWIGKTYVLERGLEE